MIEERPNVSVIVPIYNVREFLPKCIESLKSETMEGIEFILVNDGSTDGSGELARDLVNGDTRFIVLDKVNGGLSDARNHGLKYACGKYIGFVDSDDWVEPGMFAQMYEKAQATKAEVVVCKFFYHDALRKIVSVRGAQNPTTCFGHSVKKQPALLSRCGSYAWNKIFARRLFFDLGFRFPIGRAFEDSYIIYNILLAANKIELVNEPLYNYVALREGAITSSITEKIFDIFDSVESITNAYKPHTVKNPKLEKAVLQICHNHIFARYTALILAKPSRLSMQYMVRASRTMKSLAPDWQKRVVFSYKQNPPGYIRARKTLTFGLLFLFMPQFVKQAPFAYLVRKRERKEKDALARTQPLRDARNLQIKTDGPQIMAMVMHTLERSNVTCFADFGTLLGIVRDDDFVPNEQDIDIGVFARESDLNHIRAILQRRNFHLWREYKLGDKLIEQSWYYIPKTGEPIRFDLGYYDQNGDTISTHLFYRKPWKTYPAGSRDVVKMTYKKPSGFSKTDFKGFKIIIPNEAERLLEEKYGENWRVPDPEWIYWKSPAATPLRETGKYTERAVKFYHSDLLAKKLPELQSRQLNITRKILEICRLHGLTILASEGTLLGAIRHAGYIPWDDDVDLMMPRQDYQKLADILSSEPPNGLTLWSEKTDPAYHLPFMKVVALDRGNFENTSPSDIHPDFKGPRIDIFPLDEVNPRRALLLSWQDAAIRAARRAIHSKRLETKVVAGSRTFRITVNFLKKFMGFPRLHKLLERAATLQNGRSRSTHFVHWMSRYDYKKQIAPKAAFVPVEWQFEDTVVYVPKGHDEILRSIYGDYMKPPPEAKRVNDSHYMRYFYPIERNSCDVAGRPEDNERMAAE